MNAAIDDGCPIDLDRVRAAALRKPMPRPAAVLNEKPASGADWRHVPMRDISVGDVVRVMTGGLEGPAGTGGMAEVVVYNIEVNPFGAGAFGYRLDLVDGRTGNACARLEGDGAKRVMRAITASKNIEELTDELDARGISIDVVKAAIRDDVERRDQKMQRLGPKHAEAGAVSQFKNALAARNAGLKAEASQIRAVEEQMRQLALTSGVDPSLYDDVPKDDAHHIAHRARRADRLMPGDEIVVHGTRCHVRNVTLGERMAVGLTEAERNFGRGRTSPWVQWLLLDLESDKGPMAHQCQSDEEFELISEDEAREPYSTYRRYNGPW